MITGSPQSVVTGMNHVLLDGIIGRRRTPSLHNGHLKQLGHRRHGPDCHTIVAGVDSVDDAVVEGDLLPAVDGDGDDDDESCHASDENSRSDEKQQRRRHSPVSDAFSGRLETDRVVSCHS